eukprot:g6530.t1
MHHNIKHVRYPTWGTVELPTNEWVVIDPPARFPDPINPPECGYGAPYYFAARKGTDERKLIIEFMGGGACWSEQTCDSSETWFTESEIIAVKGKAITLEQAVCLLNGRKLCVDVSSEDCPCKLEDTPQNRECLETNVANCAKCAPVGTNKCALCFLGFCFADTTAVDPSKDPEKTGQPPGSMDPGGLGLGLLDHAMPPIQGHPFPNHNHVLLTYCTADLHMGNREKVYNKNTGYSVKHYGARNVRYVLDWVARQFPPSKIDEIVITGCSAGAYGAPWWSDILLSSKASGGFAYPNGEFGTKATVISDAGVGITTPDFTFTTFTNWNVQFPSSILQYEDGVCNSATMWREVATAHPLTDFGVVINKWDDEQIKFLGFMDPDSTPDSRKQLFADCADYVMGEIQNQKGPNNLHTYYLNGPTHINHCISCATDLMYTDHCQGATSTPKDWMKNMPAVASCRAKAALHLKCPYQPTVTCPLPIPDIILEYNVYLPLVIPLAKYFPQDTEASRGSLTFKYEYRLTLDVIGVSMDRKTGDMLIPRLPPPGFYNAVMRAHATYGKQVLTSVMRAHATYGKQVLTSEREFILRVKPDLGGLVNEAGEHGYKAVFRDASGQELGRLTIAGSEIEFEIISLGAVDEHVNRLVTVAIHDRWRAGVAKLSAVGSTACSMLNMGGRYDPTLACSTQSGNVACMHNQGVGCVPPGASRYAKFNSDLASGENIPHEPSYQCTPDTYPLDPFSCEVGDISGKAGPLPLDEEGAGYMKFNDPYLFLSPERVAQGLSVVVKGLYGSPLFCAHLEPAAAVIIPREIPPSPVQVVTADFVFGFLEISRQDVYVEVDFDAMANQSLFPLLPAECLNGGLKYSVHQRWDASNIKQTHMGKMHVPTPTSKKHSVRRQRQRDARETSNEADLLYAFGPEACSSDVTGGHYDPGLACGPYSDNPFCQDPNCEQLMDPKGYQCRFSHDPYTCEVGDLSGKHGPISLPWGSDEHVFSEVYVDSLLNPLDNMVGKSIVFSCPGRPRAFCAQLVVAVTTPPEKTHLRLHYSLLITSAVLTVVVIATWVEYKHRPCRRACGYCCREKSLTLPQTEESDADFNYVSLPDSLEPEKGNEKSEKRTDSLWFSPQSLHSGNGKLDHEDTQTSSRTQATTTSNANHIRSQAILPPEPSQPSQPFCPLEPSQPFCPLEPSQPFQQTTSSSSPSSLPPSSPQAILPLEPSQQTTSSSSPSSLPPSSPPSSLFASLFASSTTAGSASRDANPGNDQATDSPDVEPLSGADTEKRALRPVRSAPNLSPKKARMAGR